MPEVFAREVLRQELLQFSIGSALLLLGLMLGIGAAVRREKVVSRRLLPWAWFAGFALVVAVLNIAEVPTFRTLVLDVERAWWSRIHSVATILLPVGMLGFAEGLFTTEGSRAVRGLLRAVAGFLMLALVLEVAGLVPLHVTRSWSYALLFASIAVVTRLVWLADRKRVVGARTVLVGLALLVLVGFPDMLWGMGLQVLPVNTAPVGELCFMLALGLALVEKAQAQTRALEETNVELQHQVEARSRELRRSLTASPTAVLAESGEHRPGALIGGRYRVVRTVGSGAMGLVYEATRETDGRRVAVKTMRGAPTREDAARFAREAEFAAGLRSPHLVPVLDVGLDDGAMFLVMEFVEGPTLKELLPGPVHLGPRVLRDVARGLSALHTAGVAHRDLKPANVLLAGEGPERVARIGDFGVARAFVETNEPDATVTRRRSSTLTGTGIAVGTPRYMAPEQVRGAAVLASDIYAFAVLALEVLGAPLDVETLPWVRLERGLPAVAATVRLDDAPLAALLTRCLALEPSERPRADELVAALEKH